MQEKVKKIEGAALRLKQFVDSTSMNYSEFARQCGLNHAKNITTVCTEGNQPSAKLLDKIIKRFPMLNYDWIVLGYGEMIVKGFQTKEVTPDSLHKSTQSSFGSIQESLENHDFSLNELGKRVEEALTRVDTISEFLTNSAKQVFESQQKAQELLIQKVDNKIAAVDALLTQLVIELRDKEEAARKAEDERITRLDGQRREIWTKELNRLYEEFNRMSEKTKDHLDRTRETLTNDLKQEANLVLSSSLKALQSGFESIKEKSNENTKKAMQALAEGLGTMQKHKKT